MKPEAQWYLAEALSNARSSGEILQDYESKQRRLSHFAGVLAAFRYVGDVTQDEENLWFRKMLVALGYEVPDSAPPGVSRSVYTGDPAKRPDLSTQPQVAAVFVRSLPGPDEEYEVHGGRIRIIALEFYDSVLAIRWRVSPLPDVTFAFPEESAALEQDLEGLEDWAAEELRWKAHQNLSMRRLYIFGLKDDLDTHYVQLGANHGGGGGEISGEARFQAPPSGASLLAFTWLGLEVPIPIT